MVEFSKLIKMQLSLYRQFKDAELLGGGSNEQVKIYINRGHRLTSLFTQPLYSTQSIFKQVLYLYCLGSGFADQIDLKLTKFFLGSIFDTEFYRYIDSNNSNGFLDLFRDLDTCEKYLSSIDYKVFNLNLYTVFSYYTAFFESNIVPIIINYKDQNYI